MLDNRVHAGFVTGLALLALAPGAPAQTPASAPAPAVAAAPSPSPLTAAIEQAAREEKYLFLFVHRNEDEPTPAARKVFEAALEKLADRAAAGTVSVLDARERALVLKYGLHRSPLPLVLALAPNGAVTRAFPWPFAEEQLQTAFVSPGMQKCLKALQDRKLALLCVQNGTTAHNAEALQGVREFAADPQFAPATAIITVDPRDAAEEGFLRQLQVDPQTAEAVTVLLAPPGTLVGTYKGEVRKEVLVAAARAATQAPGCAPGSGCCPPPRKPATAPPRPPGRTPSAGGAENQP